MCGSLFYAVVGFMQFICRGQSIHFCSPSPNLCQGAVLAPRELGQPHCQIMATKEVDKAFVPNLWEMFCKADMFATLFCPHPPTPDPPCVSPSKNAEVRRFAYLEVRGFVIWYDDDWHDVWHEWHDDKPWFYIHNEGLQLKIRRPSDASRPTQIMLGLKYVLFRSPIECRKKMTWAWNTWCKKPFTKYLVNLEYILDQSSPTASHKPIMKPTPDLNQK